METNPSHDDVWSARERQWQRKLGRLRLGVEPLDVQLTRYRRVTWMLTVVPLAIALMFVSLFTAFHRPDVGLILVSIILLPVVVIAWVDYGLLKRRAAGYTRELREHQERSHMAPPSK